MPNDDARELTYTGAIIRWFRREHEAGRCRRLAVKEIKELSEEDREELGTLCAAELGAVLKTT